MLKIITVILMMCAFCYCLENNELIEETRAKKKKGALRLFGILLLLIFSKVAIFKAVSVFLFMAFFQKIFYLAGILLSHFLKGKSPMKPQPTYGPPGEYNTVGYSYGPPEHESVFPSHEYGPPNLGAFDFLKNVK